MVKLGLSLGHLGKTKTKQMLRKKYWFPLMNSMIDTAIDQYYECQVATKDNKQELIKVTNVSSRPWDTASIDHGGPYPDGHYNLVMMDKRTRYLMVERLSSTSFQTNKERFKHIFVIYGTPRRIESVNSKELKEFAEHEGFQHHPSPKGKRRSREIHANPLNKTEKNRKSARQRPS